jgi:hypothetical protein
MKKHTLHVLLFCFLVAVATTSCSVRAKAYLYTESSIQPSDVHVQTIAILPNRLPATLQDPEKWRVKNYKAIKKILTAKGFNVIDYETSNEMFKQSGLPLEDTKSSRDKYADLAQKLNADLLVFPYYATNFNSTPFSNTYISIASLQFYSLAQNDFSARVDLEGVDKISTWPSLVIPLVGTLITMVGASDQSADETTAGGVVTVLGPLYSLFILPSTKKAYDKAFNRGFKAGFDVYFSRFSPNPNGGGNRNSSRNNRDSNSNNQRSNNQAPSNNGSNNNGSNNNNSGNNAPNNNGSNNNSGNNGSNNNGSNNSAPANNGSNSGSNSNDNGGGKYAKYSVSDLETLKKAAADNGDFKTAAEIKEEIDKRKK